MQQPKASLLRSKWLTEDSSLRGSTTAGHSAFLDNGLDRLLKNVGTYVLGLPSRTLERFDFYGIRARRCSLIMIAFRSDVTFWCFCAIKLGTVSDFIFSVHYCIISFVSSFCMKSSFPLFLVVEIDLKSKTQSRKIMVFFLRTWTNHHKTIFYWSWCNATLCHVWTKLVKILLVLFLLCATPNKVISDAYKMQQTLMKFYVVDKEIIILIRLYVADAGED